MYVLMQIPEDCTYAHLRDKCTVESLRFKGK